MADRKSEISDHVIHVGAATGVVLTYAGLIPGVIPLLALTLLVTVVALLPFLAIGLVAAVVAAPAYFAWRLIGWGRRRRRRHHPSQAPAAPLLPRVDAAMPGAQLSPSHPGR